MRVIMVCHFVNKRGYRGLHRLQDSNIWHGRLGEINIIPIFIEGAGLKVPIRTF